MVAVPIKGPLNCEAVIIPLVLALKLFVRFVSKLTSLVPSKLIVCVSKSPEILKFLGVSSCVALADVPTKGPLNCEAVIIPLVLALKLFESVEAKLTNSFSANTSGIITA